MSFVNNQDAQNQPEALQRAKIFNLGEFNSDSIGLHTTVSLSNRTRSESQPGSRTDNTRTDDSKIAKYDDIE